MPACREGERTELCFGLAPFNFLEPRGGVFDRSVPSAGAFLVYSCQRVGRVNGVVFCFLRFRC